MAPFVQIRTETRDDIFHITTTVQLRSTKDKKEILNSFTRTTTKTELFVVIYFDELVSPNFQLPINTTIDDVTKKEQIYCYICGSENCEGFHCSVWYRSNKPTNERSICVNCAEKLVKCKDEIINKIPNSRLLNKSL